MNTTFQISNNPNEIIFQEHFNENNNEKSPNFKVYDILVWRTQKPKTSAYKLNYTNLNPKEITLKYSNWENVEIDEKIKENMGFFLKESKLYENEAIDCFLYAAFLKWLFNTNDIIDNWDYFILWEKIQNLNPNFQKIKIKTLKDLYENIKIWDSILTWTIWKNNIHVSTYLWNWLFIWKIWNFPPYIYNLLELNKIPWMKFNLKQEISKIKL